MTHVHTPVVLHLADNEILKLWDFTELWWGGRQLRVVAWERTRTTRRCGRRHRGETVTTIWTGWALTTLGPRLRELSPLPVTQQPLGAIGPITLKEAMAMPRYHAINMSRSGCAVVPPFVARMLPPPTERIF